jgi:hypothetical protein
MLYETEGIASGMFERGNRTREGNLSGRCPQKPAIVEAKAGLVQDCIIKVNLHYRD